MTLNSTVTGVASVGKTEAKGAADRVEPDALPVHPAEAEVPAVLAHEALAAHLEAVEWPWGETGPSGWEECA